MIQSVCVNPEWTLLGPFPSFHDFWTETTWFDCYPNIWENWLSRVVLYKVQGWKNKLNSELQQIPCICLLQTSCKMYLVITFFSFLISTFHTLFFIWLKFMRNQCWEDRSYKKLAVIVSESQASCKFLWDERM